MSQDVDLVDAVAVVGMSCRFAPDLNSPEQLWTHLAEGRSFVSDMPAKRWDPYGAVSPQATAILRKTTRRGSFLDDIEGFDADFFGISPREAAFLDPQQRIVLELAWEALVDAGIPPLSLRGTEAGVYVSANSNDYGRRLLEDITRTGAWAVNGTTYYGIANRVSYFLDLRGPSMAVDTACAGSLTALHIACQSLKLGEVPVALVGGINVMASPALFVALDAAGATSPDGRSKAFDKDADGYGRGEGAGVIVLKRLADAQRDGDPILALVVGGGVFQDGRSEGMMAPNGSAQEHMLRQAYERAGIAPSTVSYVEAHGTGTPVGDREEAQALAAVFGEGRSADDPCLVGSVKPNIGHVEAGSGIAGVIKTILALRHGEIPPSLHSEPNPAFDWQNSGLNLVAARTPWDRGSAPRRAGVSSYGVGGSIAHVILQEAPEQEAPDPAAPGPRAPRRAVFPLSAMSEAGLAALARDTSAWLTENPDADLAAIGHTLADRRSHLSSRAAVVAGSVAELTTRLDAVAAEERGAGIARARTSVGSAAGIVWVFSGHGAQWSGMGRQLLAEETAFATVIDLLADVYEEEMGWTPREAITTGGPWTTSHVQAMTFAIQVALAEVWRSRGIAPAAVIGHSVGEIAAAVAAGALDLQEAARFACRRALALQQIEGHGAMALIGLSFDEIETRLSDRRDIVAAISSSPNSTVVSGSRAAIATFVDVCAEQGIEVWNVDTDVAFHSPQIDAVVAEIGLAAADLHPRTPGVLLYSTALADPRSDAVRDARYWVANIREPVRCAEAVTAALGDGFRHFVEISSHPVVAHSIRETFAFLDIDDAAVVPSLRRDSDEMATILDSLASLHCHGGEIDWTAQWSGRELAPLPAVAWQHRPYWIFPASVSDSGLGGGGHDPATNNLLGGRSTVSGAPARQVWQTYLDLTCRPYPLDHQVVGVEITPAAVILDSFVAAVAHGGTLPAMSDIVLRTPLAVVPPRVVQIVLSDNALRLASRVAHEDDVSDDQENEWITHSTAVVDRDIRVPEGTVEVDDIRARCTEEWSWQRVDDMFRRMGVGGYAFPWDVDELLRNEVEQIATIAIVPPPAEHAGSWAHVIDGALTISAVLVTPEFARHQWMSSHMNWIVFEGEPPARIFVHSRRAASSPSDTVDVQVADETGRIVCEVNGLRFSAISDSGEAAAPREMVHEIAWRPLEATGNTAVDRVVIVGDGSVGNLTDQLVLAGIPTLRAPLTADLDRIPLTGSGAVVVAPAPARPGESPVAAAERNAWMLVQTAQRLHEAQLDLADDGARMRLWCVTRDVRDGRDDATLAYAPLWGTARIIAGEHPEMWGGLIDLASADTGVDLLAILRTAAGQEDVISVGAVAEVPRLAPVDRRTDGTPTLQCRPADTYLITGGLGALGLLVAHWLVERGARRILLAGRTGLPSRTQWAGVTDPRVRRQIDGVLALEALGVSVGIVAVDITDAEQVAAALDPSATGMPPIRGIIHAAGVTHDAMLSNVDRAGLHDVLSPKAEGAMVLHGLFPPGVLDFFVMFSSCGQFARLTGQTSYATANSFLDGLAALRCSTGHTETTSIGWTSWRGVGMSETIAGTMAEANSRGLEAVTVDEAFRAWAYADRFDAPYQAILRLLPTTTARPPMFRELTATTAGSDGRAAQNTFTIDWVTVPEQEARDLVTADVREQVAAELNLAAPDVELRRPLVELGIDSVMSVALRVRMGGRYGLDLPPTILWHKPTVDALAGHVFDSLRPQTPAESAGEDTDKVGPTERLIAVAGGVNAA